MRRVRYSVVMSLDGYIAGPNGEYDWIEFDPEAAAPFFKAFYAQFDTAVMGRKSFDQFPGPVEGMQTYVFSRTLVPADHENVTVLGDEGIARLAELRAGEGKDIWLWGGGELFGSLVAAGLVDMVEVSVVPVILGGGVRLMAGHDRDLRMTISGAGTGSGGGPASSLCSVYLRVVSPLLGAALNRAASSEPRVASPAL